MAGHGSMIPPQAHGADVHLAIASQATSPQRVQNQRSAGQHPMTGRAPALGPFSFQASNRRSRHPVWPAGRLRARSLPDNNGNGGSSSSAQSRLNPSSLGIFGAESLVGPGTSVDETSAEEDQDAPMCLINEDRTGCVPMNVVVFSGGTAMNSVAPQFQALTTHVTHILPVSDDGGSTAEIVRVLGGPAVGDIRSRCLRLADSSDSESRAVAQLLAHRLHSTDPTEAKREWMEIVEGESSLWNEVSEPYKHTIRAFLVHFHSQILSHATLRFNFSNGSIGNFFFAGARTFFRSLEAAIFLFSRVARIPEGSLVLPVVATEDRMTLGAELEDGTVIRGQNEISHPPAKDPGAAQTSVDKDSIEKLPSRVKRIFYLSSEGDHQEHEVFPMANQQVLQRLETADVITYGMGSLYSSICPTLIIRGMGEAIAASGAPKVLILNGFHDRETAACESDARGMSASDIVQAVCTALNRTYTHSSRGARLHNSPKQYVTAVVVPQSPGKDSIAVDEQQLRDMGVQVIYRAESHHDEKGRALYNPQAIVEGIQDIVLEHNTDNGADVHRQDASTEQLQQHGDSI